MVHPVLQYFVCFWNISKGTYGWAVQLIVWSVPIVTCVSTLRTMPVITKAAWSMPTLSGKTPDGNSREVTPSHYSVNICHPKKEPTGLSPWPGNSQDIFGNPRLLCISYYQLLRRQGKGKTHKGKSLPMFFQEEQNGARTLNAVDVQPTRVTCIHMFCKWAHTGLVNSSLATGDRRKISTSKQRARETTWEGKKDNICNTWVGLVG